MAPPRGVLLPAPSPPASLPPSSDEEEEAAVVEEAVGYGEVPYDSSPTAAYAGEVEAAVVEEEGGGGEASVGS